MSTFRILFRGRKISTREFHSCRPSLKHIRPSDPKLLGPDIYGIRNADTSDDSGTTGVNALPEEWIEDLLEDEYDNDDTTTLGHMVLQEYRDILYYLRVIEHDMPKLVAYRKPFIPPTTDTPIVSRTVEYIGEEHPIDKRRAIVVPVDDLPLRDPDAVHKIKLLAGPRWSLRPPRDAGISPAKGWGNGFIKISCDEFPKPGMNLKWACDTLGKLLEEANKPDAVKFKDVPLDSRHIYARAMKDQKGEHRRGRIHQRPSIHDFPLEWLPANSRLLESYKAAVNLQPVPQGQTEDGPPSK